MRRLLSKKVLLFIGVSLFLFTLGMWLFFKYELIEFVPFNEELRTLLNKRLVRVDSLPESLHSQSSTRNNVIYVLGGNQDNLRKKFIIAAELYHKGVAKKILSLSRPGITEYSSIVERNLTNDEWAIERLIKLGIEREDIEFLSIEEDFLGTFAEAKDVSAVFVRRVAGHLIVISSPYHTMRTWLCFSNYL